MACGAICVCDIEPRQPHWVAVLFKDGQSVTFGADGEVLRGRLLVELSHGFGPVQRSQKGRQVQPRPFVHPHYWAGFVLTGDRQ